MAFIGVTKLLGPHARGPVPEIRTECLSQGFENDRSNVFNAEFTSEISLQQNEQRCPICWNDRFRLQNSADGHVFVYATALIQANYLSKSTLCNCLRLARSRLPVKWRPTLQPITLSITWSLFLTLLTRKCRIRKLSKTQVESYQRA